MHSISVLMHLTTLPTKVKNIKTKVKFLARFPNFSLQKEMCTYALYIGIDSGDCESARHSVETAKDFLGTI